MAATKKLRIAIISNDDKLWSLYAWNNVFNSHLLDEYELAGFWTCEQKFGDNKKLKVWQWYLSTFKLWNFIKLFGFVVSFKFFSFIKSLSGKFYHSFASMCKSHKVPYSKVNSPNDPEFIKWVKENNIDVLIIMVDHILKKEIIAAPNVCVVNKHASLLPANKGLFPFFWAKLHNETQGISFHKVIEAIDEGELYYQEKVEDKKLIKSMIAFYFYVHKNYYKMLETALHNIASSTVVSANNNSSSQYYSRPNVAYFNQFKKNGGKIITLGEIFLPFFL